MNHQSSNHPNQLLDAVCRRGVLCSVSVRYWRGCKQLKAEDLGLDPGHVNDRLIRLGHKRLVPKDALQPFALIEQGDNSTVVVHQRTLDRLTGFIDRFRSLNFAGDARLEQTLEQFREELLTRSAEDYRNDRSAMVSLTGGLERLRENAVQLARSDAREVAARFGSGSLGRRRLAVA